MEDILKILEDDARTTPEQIATMLGRQVAEVGQRAPQHDDIVTLRCSFSFNPKLRDFQVYRRYKENVEPL